MNSPYKRVGKRKIMDEVLNTKIAITSHNPELEEELTFLFEELNDILSYSKEKAVNIGTAIIQAFLLGKSYKSTELRRDQDGS